MLPTPTRDAVLTQNAWNEDTWFFSVLEPAPEATSRTISLNMRIWTAPVVIVKNRPAPMRIKMIK